MSQPSRWPLPPDGVRFVAPGFSREFFTHNPLTRGCFPLALGYYPHARDHQMQRTVHDDHLLVYCVAGAGQLHTARGQRTVAAGDVLILPKGVAHRYWADAQQPWSLYWCHFDGCDSADFIAQLTPANVAAVLPLGHCSAVIAAFKAMLAVRNTGYHRKALILAANQLRQLLAQLPLEVDAFGLPQHHGVNIDKVQALMWASIGGFLTLDALASSANVSKFHFSAVYKKLTGFAPIRHFTQMKMEHACFLLDSSARSISEIAAELGYDDSLYFSRVFKNTLGLSPRAYRRAH